MESLRSLKKLIIGESNSSDIDDGFIYWWDDVQTQDYIEEEQITLSELLMNNILTIIHFTLFLPIIPLVILLAGDYPIVASIMALLSITVISTSYLLINYLYVIPNRTIEENMAKINNEKNLSGTDSLLFGKEEYEVLASFDAFRSDMVGIIQSIEQNVDAFSKEVNLTQSMFNSVNSSIDQISLSIDNSIASPAVFQETKGYTNQVSKGIDDLTESFDSTLDSMTEVSNILKSIGKQTTMLALNAGIEAAKAGNRGRGFEIVASNLRRLAQHATESANKIQSRSDNIENQAKEALEYITTGMIDLNSLIDKNHDTISSLNNDLYTNVNDLNRIRSEHGKLFSLIENQQAIVDKYRY